ncbi:hypothetical protein Ddye_014681 [Dipteronia dyeriana]|uniref:Thioredoxin domain-containing protein n=1 Tax=Dipteronia dyeriana TaxID=168575 RepID=A0AAD9X8G0_9ROSI|nr:hypothetical protein Ddye_014681 [Dipteronia dyeriana]
MKPYIDAFPSASLVTAFDNKISSKLLLESDLTSSNIETNASGQIVVGKKFDDLVLNGTQNVFLEVHTPWCINCETMSKRVEKLAKHFEGLDNVFARLDASANEDPILQWQERQYMVSFSDTATNELPSPLVDMSETGAGFDSREPVSLWLWFLLTCFIFLSSLLVNDNCMQLHYCFCNNPYYS